MDPADEDTWLLPRRAFVRIGDRAADSIASLPPQRKAPRKTPDGEMEKCRCSP